MRAEHPGFARKCGPVVKSNLPDTDPNTIFPGRILIVAPHMDDEALACGGLIARLNNKEQIFIVYATDGMKSPAPVVPGVDAISPDLGQVRVKEATAAMEFLGVPKKNLCFLELPEAQLQKNLPALKNALIDSINEISPDYIFIPFRYDRHPDHLAINGVITQGRQRHLFSSQIVEYFVYHRWRLLPKRDIRSYIKPGLLIKIDMTSVSTQKRNCLDFFTSQTTRYYPWQTRPILTPILLDEESRQPEYFLFYDPSKPGTDVFTSTILWIRLAHRLEPFLLKWKYLTGSYLKRALKNDANRT
jgi:LmbE family N-acetylglucosaminyl deacetylase